MSSGVPKPTRLPPLASLRVRNPNRKPERPCISVMSSVLACWASAGHATAGCQQLEQALRSCMDSPRPPKPKPNEINYHLARFQTRITDGKRKKK